MTPAVTVLASMTAGEAWMRAEASASGVVVIDARGALQGVVTRERLVAAEAGGADGALAVRVSDLLEERFAVRPDVSLDEAMELIAEANLRWAPVVEGGVVVGRIGMRDVVRTYKSTLRQSVRRATALPPETALFEVDVSESSPLVGRPLAESRLPASTLVVSMERSCFPVPRPRSPAATASRCWHPPTRRSRCAAHSEADSGLAALWN
jgi:hypothetical protein